MKSIFTLPNVIKAVTGVSVVVATLKWIVDNVGGQSLPPQAILFYVPYTVLLIYIMVCAVVIGAGYVHDWWTGAGNSESETALIIGALLGGAVGAYLLYPAVFLNGPSYNTASSSTRIVLAGLGFLILAASILAYLHLQRGKSSQGG